ncbi:MAG: hypothetical protein J6C84_06900 [Lachnospiraceae bacterium]|nr:hypothetical protein [Lachnospiraceae bacterium]
MGKTEKSAGSISVIGGADGPTSFFIGGNIKNHKAESADRSVPHPAGTDREISESRSS